MSVCVFSVNACMLTLKTHTYAQLSNAAQLNAKVAAACFEMDSPANWPLSDDHVTKSVDPVPSGLILYLFFDMKPLRV